MAGFYEKHNPWASTVVFTFLYFVFSSLIAFEVLDQVDLGVTFVYSLIFGIVYFLIAKFVLGAKL